MPELPEVETVARGLRELINGKQILSAKLIGAKHKAENPRNFSALVKGKTVTEIVRRGKHLLIHLSENQTLWCHLRMTGQFIEHQADDKLDKHDHAHFVFAGKTKKSRCNVVFRDVRKFGYLRLVPSDELDSLKEITQLGPEPLTISASDFVALFADRKRVIKPALLDQHILVGLLWM